jgi:hypothetical protein
MGDFGQPSVRTGIMACVGLLDGLRRRRSKTGGDTSSRSTGAEHLEAFASSRRGVEAWVERPTAMAGFTLLLVAYDGEWTRRSVPSEKWARAFAERHRFPCYDAGVVPYPQRMRDFNSRALRRKRSEQD